MTDLYSDNISGINATKDYFNLYETTQVNSGIYNSSIYRIQAKYTNYNADGTGTNNTTTKLYSGNSTDKKLLLKIIYTLKSDVDNPTTHRFNNPTILSSETNIEWDDIEFPSSNILKFPENTTRGYNYITGNDDNYKIIINNTNRIKIELYDFRRR